MTTTTKTIDLAALRAAFPFDRISWRVGATKADKSQGIAFAYIDARDVMHRLDAVCGADWQCEYTSMQNGTCCCKIGIKIDGEWRWRANGAVNVADSDKPEAQEMAEKGSYSDAFKRAAVLWGIGQYLYDLDNIWVDLKPQGKSHVIDMGKCRGKLEAALKAAASHIAPPPRVTPAEPITETPEQTAKRLAEQHNLTTAALVDSPLAKAREALKDASTFARSLALTDRILANIDAKAEGWTAGGVGSLLQFAAMRMIDTAENAAELDQVGPTFAKRLDDTALSYVTERLNKRYDKMSVPA